MRVRVQLAPELGDLPSILTVNLQDANNLVAGQVLDQANAMAVTDDNTNLGGGQALLGQFADELLGLLGAGLQPPGSATAVRDGRTRNTLTKIKMDGLTSAQSNAARYPGVCMRPIVAGCKNLLRQGSAGPGYISSLGRV